MVVVSNDVGTTYSGSTKEEAEMSRGFYRRGSIGLVLVSVLLTGLGACATGRSQYRGHGSGKHNLKMESGQG